MNKMVLPQKSIISQAFKRIISGLALGCMVLGLPVSVSGCSGTESELSVQQKKRLAQKGHVIALQGMVDSLVVYKSKREMAAFRNGRKVKTYIVSLGTAPEGRKRMQGDRKTPEGIYYIDGKNAGSIYHRNLGISYPNATDRKYASEHGLNTGGDIKIHGLPNKQQYKTEDYLYSDWTWGCIAVSNEEIEELYRYVAVGTVVRILP